MPEIIAAEFEDKDSQVLRKVAKLRDESISTFLRRAVRLELARLGYLSNDESKALGIRGIEK